MDPTKPTILWRAIAGESLRLTLLTASIAAVVVAFAAGVQPLADGRLGPGDALKYMALAAPAMLQFVLPFAAGFGATLSHHRMASENELTAAVAAGVSRGSLLAPTIAVGLALALFLAAFNNFAMPRLLRSMSAMIQRDAGGLIVSAIRRGDAADLGDVRVHADGVASDETNANGDQHIVLTGVVAVGLDDAGRVETDVAARVADVWLRRTVVDGRDATIVSMRLFDAAFKRPDGLWASQEQTNLAPWLIPSRLDDDPAFRTLPELLALARDASGQRSVQRRRRELAAAIARVEIVRWVRDTLEAQSRLDFTIGSGGRLALRASSARVLESGSPVGEAAEIVKIALAPLVGEPGVRLDWFDESGQIRRQVAREAALTLTATPESDRFDAALALADVQTLGPSPTTRQKVERGGLALARDPAPAIFALSADALAARAASLAEQGQSDSVAVRRLERLHEESQRVQREALGNLHERAALSLACAVMMAAGAVAAMLLTQVSPLVVYLWSFLPSLVGVVAISGGENAVRDQLALGLATLWAGVGVVACFALAMFLRVRRH